MIHEDVVRIIEEGTDLEFGKTLFWGSMPDKPDTAVTVYEYQGSSPVFSKTGVEASRPRVQIVTRSRSYSEAVELAYALYKLLATTKGITFESDTGQVVRVYDSLRPLQEPFADPSGRDDAGRVRMMCNYSIRIRMQLVPESGHTP